ncbi:hypothetical protein EXIGUO8H_10107 [Exiguobacterium sp. 8H]
MKMKTNCGANTKLDNVMRRTILEKFCGTWSPEQIIDRLFDYRIAILTTYHWIYMGQIDTLVNVFCPERETSKKLSRCADVSTLNSQSRNVLRDQVASNVRALRVRHRRLRRREIEGMCRDVHRAKNLVISLPADQRP